MTEVPTPKAPTAEELTEQIIANLAQMVLDDETGFALDHLDELGDILTHRAFVRLCLAIDFCPTHQTDLDSCLDDDRRCTTEL